MPKLYALHDKKAKALSSFHVEKSDPVASRNFAEAVKQKDSVFQKYPEDFELVALAEVRDEVHERVHELVQPFVAPFVVITAEQIVATLPHQEA